jgi:acetyl-CoA carboxylase biotin carboxyl carrier protein
MENGSEKKEQKEHKSDPLLGKDHFKEILSYIEKTDLEYVQIERDGKKISLRRSNVAVPDLMTPQAAAPSDKEEKEDARKLFSIRSPIVGKFYRSMGSDLPALVVEGGVVTAGQKVAIVEAMKIKKEVFSAVTGKVLRILVKNGEAVEYGQELFSVEPEERAGD